MQVIHSGASLTELQIRRRGTLRAVVSERTRDSLDVLEASARRVLRGPRHGRRYRWHGRLYQASAPGEPPAMRSGRLSATLVGTWTVRETANQFQGTATLTWGAPYADIVAARRPWLAFVLRDAQPGLRRLLRARLALP